MKKLFLFDIDNTLIIGSHDNRFARVIQSVHGIDPKLEVDIQGLTDKLILAVLLKNEGWDETQIEDAMPKLIEELDVAHATTFKPENVTILPGIRELLEALKAKGHVLGLITGNLHIIAERKLSAVGIWDYFELGGFSSDPHKTRGDLVTVAIERAGYADRLQDVYVVGDTARDIQAAHEAGVENSVGVTNGLRDKQELIDAKAKYVFEDFTDTDQALGDLGL